MLGVDVSVYSGEISPAQWQAIKADGYEVAVVGLWHGGGENPFASDQLAYARVAGLETAAYVALSRWHSGDEQVEWGLAAIERGLKESLRFVAIDCELDGVTADQITEALVAVGAAGLRPIIYTGCWWWWQNLGMEFKDVPVWLAQYDNDPNPDLTVLCGGWTRDKLVGKQYAGTTMLHGVNVDLNWFDDSFVKGETMPPFTEEQEKRIREIHSLEPPGLEMQARMATLAAIRAMEISLLAGHWKELPQSLKDIKRMLEAWHRWEGE